MHIAIRPPPPTHTHTPSTIYSTSTLSTSVSQIRNLHTLNVDWLLVCFHVYQIKRKDSVRPGDRKWLNTVYALCMHFGSRLNIG